MSLEYVSKGQSVRASTINSIIDAIGGNQTMSPDLEVTTTKGGQKVSMPSKYGGKLNPSDHILEQSNYMLSGWPMAQLNLGAEIQDCLGAIKVHKVDGSIDNATSAFVVYQNSSDCPTGSSLSGYLLQSSDFGQDKLVGAAGWVKTMMEDPHPGGKIQAQLWKYGEGSKLAEVFTNVPDVGDVKSQLSSTMSQNNISASDLSSLSHVCGWDLVASHILSGDNDETYPTHDLVMNHGQLDYWESGSEKLNVVLRADYVCLSAEYDNDDQLQSSTWGWKIPLGEGATCYNGKTHTPNLTYGGNEVVFEIDEGDPGGAEDVFKDGCIWHGADTVSVGQQVSPETVYINLHWDYQSKCVIGELSDTPAQGSYTQDGILHRSIYVAKCAPFTPSTMAKVGDLADGELVEHGTFGDFTQDGPKMDSYCQHDSNVRFQSLDWDDLGGDVVSCQVQQLHGFSDLENHTDADEEDQLVVRRKDDDGGAEIRYVDLSSVVSSLLSAEVQTDTDSPNSDLSSIQWTDDEGGNPVLQLFKFDDHEAVEAQDSDEVVVKRGDGVEYVQLSTIVVSGDTNQGNIGKSIETTEDGNGNKYHQLYKFDGGGLSDTIQVGVQLNGNAESLVPDEYEFVLRKNGASGEIEYAKIELSAFDVELSADSDVGEQKSIDIDNAVIQLHDMDESGEDLSALVPHCFAEPQDPLSSLSAEFVIRKGGAGGEIGYVALELLQDKTPLDRNTYHTQKSLQYATIDNVSFLELNGFHSDATSDVPVAVLSSDAKSLLPANWQFLTRHKDQNGYWQLGYSTLSAMVSGALSVNVDSDVVAQKSLEWAEDDGQEYLQLYGMDVAGRPTEQVDLKLAKTNYHDLLPDDEEFVIRTGVGGEIIYKNLAVTLSAFTSGTAYEISGDTNLGTLGRKSIETKEDSTLGEKYHQLYNFDNAGTLSPSDLSSGGIEVVVRDSHTTGGNGARINYIDLSAITESLSGGTSISGDHDVIPGYSNSIDTQKDSRGTYHQLYGFENPATRNFWQLTEGRYQFVIRDYNSQDKYIVYSDISSFVTNSTISGDSNLYYPPSRTIAYKNEQGSRFYQFYNWNDTAADQRHVISAAFGETRYFPFQDGTGTATDLGNAAHILTRPRMGSTNLHYDAYGIRLPKVSPTDVTQELYDLILSGGGTDVSAVRQIVIDTLDDSDAKGPLSSNLNDCFWPQGGDNSDCWGSGIGDSLKRRVIDLDSNTLYAVGSNQSAVDWAGDTCYDSQGTQSILWDGRGLIDTGSQWALDWENRQCLDSTVTPTVDWENGALKVPASGNNSVDWTSGVLYDPNNGNVSLNWDVGYAMDPTGSGVTVNWNTGQLWADNNTRTLNWKSRQLIGNWRTNGNLTIGGNGSTLTIGNTTITEAQLTALLALI